MHQMGSIPKTNKSHAICIPYPAQGHINPMMKLAKLLHSKGFHISFVNTHYNHKRLLRSNGPSSLNGLPDFRFYSIPDGLPPSDADATQSIPAICESVPKHSLEPFCELITKLNDAKESDVPPVSSIVSDGCMSFTLEAAERFGLPEVLFWTPSACGVLAYTHYRDLIEKGYTPLKGHHWKSHRLAAKHSFSRFKNSAADPVFIDSDVLNKRKSDDIITEPVVEEQVNQVIQTICSEVAVDRASSKRSNKPLKKSVQVSKKLKTSDKTKKDVETNKRSVPDQNETKKGKRKIVFDLEADNSVCEPFPLRSIRVRTTPTQLCNVMCSLSAAQRKCVEDIGFGSLLGFNISSIPGRLGYFVVNNFDPTTMAIKTMKGNIICDRKAVHDIFGIPMGGIDFKLLEYKGHVEFVRNWVAQYPQDKLIRASTIGEKVLSSTVLDRQFEMNVAMLFVITMIRCESNGAVDLTFLKHLADDVDIKSFDWCGYLLQCLETSKIHWKNAACYYSGPITFLVLLYLDRTKFDMVPIVRERPLFRNLKAALFLREKFEVDLGRFGTLEIVDAFNEDEEKDEGFLTLDQDKKVELNGKEEYYALMEEKLELALNTKRMLLRICSEGLSKFCEDEMMKNFEKRINDVFSFDKVVVVDIPSDVHARDDDDIIVEDHNKNDDNDDGTEVYVEKDIHDGEEQEEEEEQQEVVGEDVHGDFDATPVVGGEELVGEQVVEQQHELVGEEQEEEDVYDDATLSQWFDAHAKDYSPFDKSSETLDVLVAAAGIAENMGKEKIPKTAQPILPKRQLKLAPVCRSPFINKKSVVSASVSASEFSLSMEMFSMLEDPNEIVFQTQDHALNVRRLALESLCPTLPVEASVIDLWSFLLNCEEKFKNPNAPSRFFFASSVINSYWFDDKKMSKSQKFDSFESNVKAFIGDDIVKMSFKSVDLVFFPVNRHNHFYVLVFDLRLPSLTIIDNTAEVPNFILRYKKVCNLVQYVFAKHLQQYQHKMGVKVESLKPYSLKMPWRTRENNVDCGIFTMHHMERYAAQSEDKWSCSLVVESQEQIIRLRKLRMRFVAKILSHEKNICAEDMLRKATIFRRKHSKAEIEMIVLDAIINRENRVDKVLKDKEGDSNVVTNEG